MSKVLRKSVVNFGRLFLFEEKLELSSEIVSFSILIHHIGAAAREFMYLIIYIHEDL